MSNQINALKDEQLKELADLTQWAAKVKRRMAERTAAIEAAKKEIKDRGEFIPKNTDSRETVGVRF